jgi:CBS domain-containing protein
MVEDNKSPGKSEAVPLCHVPISELLEKDPITLSDDTPVREVIQIMQKERVGAVIVLARGKLKGVFSEWHLVERVIGQKVDLDSPVGEFLDKDPACLKKDDDIGQAIDLMAKRELRYLPICSDQGEFHGILSVRKIIDCLAHQFPTEIINQPPRADQQMAAPEGG